LYIPDDILVIDLRGGQAWRVKYDFVFAGVDGLCSTQGLSGDGKHVPFDKRTELPEGVSAREFGPGEFAKMVDVAKEKFARGDLFEAVLSQTFREPCKSPPSDIFRCLQKRNPSPYGFLMNLGDDEFLVGASPEMFVRVEHTINGLRCETCPISGTIRRGANALEDAENIRRILTDPKEESEITMCTDVDRNDKSRICKAGTVQVIGRRQIELYSRLIHTVDHVEGYLRPEFDALDAFLVHTWAVTVCGAPKAWAMQFVEEQERSQRCWYGASVGHVAFDGHLNTGLTLRTVKIKRGVAEVRAGATLLFDSVPESEEKETELKASACRAAVANPYENGNATNGSATASSPSFGGQHAGKSVLLIDFEDSFVHTLANYLRQTGAEVITVRHTQAEQALSSLKKPDLAVLSPGPGRPTDFQATKHIARLLDLKIPIFGVCLGLQSLVEHFGGKLNQLKYPMHGKPSEISLTDSCTQSKVLAGLPKSFCVARYHSLYGSRPLPDCLDELAYVAPGEEGGTETIVMAIQHKTLPIAAVQFHPESILTSPKHGVDMLSNALKMKY
jgi:anthranilate synthase